jgi:UDP-glucose 4-epimerase
MHKTIIITGCSGYIGSHAAYYFKKQNYKIIGCDLKDTNNHFVKNSLDEFYQMSFDDQKFIEKTNKIKNLYKILHFAGNPSVKKSFLNPEETWDCHYYRLFNFLNNFNNKKINFIFPSTCYVYEDKLSPYGETKLAAEDLLKIFSQKINYKIYRLYNIAGCYNNLVDTMNQNQLIPTLINAELQNKEFFIPKNNSGVKNFLYIHDLMKQIENDNYIRNTTFDLANNVNISIQELVDLYERIFSVKINKIYLDKEEPNFKTNNSYKHGLGVKQILRLTKKLMEQK